MTTQMKVTATVCVDPSAVPGPVWATGTRAYRVTLHYEGRTMEVPYYVEYVSAKAPTARDTLSYLLAEAMTVEAMEFVDWCEERGYFETSYARRMYTSLIRQTNQLRAFLGTKTYEALMDAVDHAAAVREICRID